MHTYDQPETFTSNHIMWGWRHIGAVIGMFIAGLLAILGLLRVVQAFGLVNADSGLSSPVLYIAVVVIYGLVIGGVYLFAARFSGWEALGVRVPPWWTLAVTPPLLLAALFGMAFINEIVSQFSGRTFQNPQIEVLTRGGTFPPSTFILLLLLIAGLAPIAEELFFRGMLYPVLRQQMGPGGAIVSSAAIFAVLHFIPVLIPSLFFVGLLLGFLREWSKSILPPIALHIMQNGFVLMGIYALQAGWVQS